MLDVESAAQYAGVEGCYLLAFYRRGQHVPYGVGRYGQALHYLGYAKDVGRRLAEHRNANGARLTAVVVLAGWELRLVRVWPGATRADEKRLKSAHNAGRFCPHCWGAGKGHAA